MTTLLSIAPVVLPVFGALGYATAGWRRATEWLGAACAGGVLAAGIALAAAVTSGQPHVALGGLLRADALSAFMIVVIGAVAVLATAASPGYLGAEIAAGRATARTARRQSVLVQVFLATMAFTVLAANLGVLWVGIEATTIVTAFLVGQRRTRAAVEAAWKYVVICSVGIALAFLGTVLLNFAAAQRPAAGGEGGLDWASLAVSAPELDQGVTRIAVALLIIGFGTKAGLAPLHAWLPDAHGQAPAPVSALMSGVLLSVAFYAVLRVKVISDAALGPGFARALLVVVALASLAVAASLMIAQRDYKRMLAYSSIEHMGLLALGGAVGGRLAMTAVLLHVLGHGLTKAVLFLGSGRLLQVTGSTAIAEVRGLAVREPLLAGAFGFGVLALVGLPPFSLFASELGIARAGFAGGLGWVTAAALLLVVLIGAAMVAHTSRMLLGAPADGPVGGPGAATAVRPSTPARTAVPLLAGLAACAAIGIALGPLGELLRAAATAAGAAP